MEEVPSLYTGLVNMPRARFGDSSLLPNTQRDVSTDGFILEGVSIAGFTNELRWHWFTSVVGAEYCHTYFWIAKDIAWMQGWKRFSVLFGLAALLWSFVILYHALRTTNWHELWNFVGLFLFLFANYWWMLGESHDNYFPNERIVGPTHTEQSSYILSFTIVFLGVFYGFLQPMNILPITVEAASEYDDGVLKPRLPWLKSFRQYENLHLLAWAGKDYFWNRMNFPMWTVCLMITLFISGDLLYIASAASCEDSSVDIVHFVVVFIWVVGNSIWAFGDFIPGNYDEPVHLLDFSWKSIQTARWCSSWILVSTFVPLVTMYCTWYYLTVNGRLLPPRSGTSSGSGSGSRRARRHFSHSHSHSRSSVSLPSLLAASSSDSPLCADTLPLLDPVSNI